MVFRINVDSQWNPVDKVFYVILFVETNQFVGSDPNVIFTSDLT